MVEELFVRAGRTAFGNKGFKMEVGGVGWRVVDATVGGLVVVCVLVWVDAMAFLVVGVAGTGR